MPLFASKTTLKIDLVTTLSIKQWTSDNLKQWLTDSGYDRKTVIDPIYKQQFDGSAIIIIKPEDLIEFGIPRGAALSLLSKVKDIIEKQVQLGILQQHESGSGGLLASPGRVLSPRASPKSSSASLLTSPRTIEGGNNTNLYSNICNNGAATTSGTVYSTSTIKNHASSHGVLPVHYSNHEKGNDDSNNIQKKGPPTLPRKSEATLLLQAKVVQQNHDVDITDHDCENLDDELAFDIEHGLKINQSLNSHDGVSNIHSNSCKNTIDPSDIPEIPMWNLDEMNDQQKEQFKFCFEKLKNLTQSLHGEQSQVICQNLSFPERFRYKYLNSMSVPRFENRPFKEPFIKVKLIITEMDDGSLHRFIRRFGSMIDNSSIKKMEFGMFHAALIIGPWYVEWGNSSIAVVRNRSSSKAVFAMDVGRIEGENEISKSLDKLTAICTFYNTRKEYDNKKCNCQHFVESVLEHVGLLNAFEEKLKNRSIRKFINTLKKEGVCDMSYRVEPAIRDLIHLDKDTSEELKLLVNEKYITFRTHRILDEFVTSIKKKSKLYFEGSGESDYQLLKAFDRAFWLQSQSSKQQDPATACPLSKSNTCLCPFNKEQNYTELVNNTIVGIDYDFGNVKMTIPLQRK